ncbi:hypothetical protein EDD22DRAFT_847914 [Suillus occidentalis]|nr:hypothetical protein EDD22DRAFT_847914 [Suillus occidentalis]
MKFLDMVSVDKARFKTWRQYLTEFNEVLLATRMVFDEAHLTLLSEEFRVSLQDVHKLRQFPMQLVLLMAIMPHSSILALKHMFGLLSTAIEIRELINCPKLEYIMRQPAQSNTLESKAIQIVVQERQQWTSEDRGLVFVTYMKNSKSLSERTYWPFYNGSKDTSDATRAKHCKDWCSGKSLIMIYREGTECKADERNQLCCICKNNVVKELDQLKATTQQHAHVLQKSLHHRCTVSTNLPPLQQHTLATANSKKLKTAKQAEEMKQVDWMRKSLNVLKDKGCTLCYGSGDGEGRFHKLGQCHFWKNMRFSLGKYSDWKKEIRYNNHKGICWKCHMLLTKGKGDE